MRAYIYSGGEVFPEKIKDRPGENDLVIAADAGYENAISCGVTPSLLVGDFDSLQEIPEGIERIEVPAKKDFTDTQLAVKTALERGADDIVIVGGLGGRCDHTLSNLALLEFLNRKKVRAILLSGRTRARFLRNGGVILLHEEPYRYFSLLSADESVRGVTVEGAVYPLRNAKLSRFDQYAVSNEWSGNCVLISVKRGGLWILEETEEPVK